MVALQTQTVVDHALFPQLQIDHQVDHLVVLDRRHAKQLAHVDDADAPQLHIIADQLRRRADQLARSDLMYFHSIVGNEPVAPLDQLYRRLALAHAALAQQQHALAVDLYQHAVPGHSGGEMPAEGGNEAHLNICRIALSAQQCPPVLLRSRNALREELQIPGNNDCRNGMGKQILKPSLALLRGQFFQIRPLHLAQQLDPLVVKVVVKSHQLQARAVDVHLADADLFVISIAPDHLKIKFLDNGAQLCVISRSQDHRLLFCKVLSIFHSIASFAPFGNGLFVFSRCFWVRSRHPVPFFPSNRTFSPVL